LSSFFRDLLIPGGHFSGRNTRTLPGHKGLPEKLGGTNAQWILHASGAWDDFKIFFAAGDLPEGDGYRGF